MNDVACIWVFQKRLKIGVGRRSKAFLGLFLTDWGAFLASEHIAINMDPFWTPILIGLGSLMCTRAKLMSTKMVAPEGNKKSSSVKLVMCAILRRAKTNLQTSILKQPDTT